MKLAHSRLYVVAIFACVLYLLFYPSLQKTSLFKNLINFFTVNESRNWIDVASVLIFVAASTYLFWHITSWIKSSINLLQDVVPPFTLIAIYLLHRFMLVPGQTWYFAGISDHDGLKYMDIVIFSIVLLMFNPRKRFVSSTKSTNPLLEDNYFNSTNTDVFSRQFYASHIADIIKSQKVSQSFAIGVHGRWGSGKTVFLQQILSKLRNEVITAEFSPWLSSDPLAMEMIFLS